MPPRVGKIIMDNDNGNDNNNNMHGEIEDLEQLEFSYLAVGNAKWKTASQCFCNAKHAVTI